MIKILLTIFVIILVPVYWQHYGAQNFLWLSDIGLFLTLIALLLESPLLLSTTMLCVLPVEIIWSIDFFFQLISGNTLLGIAHYMFESEHSLFIRALSLFHIFVPLIWFWYSYKWGYDKRALPCATLLLWVVMLATYLLTDPAENINWVFTPHRIILMLIIPVAVYWPLTIIFQRTFNRE